ncbi:MAG: beta-lactamase family protein [Actinomycetia bacterium]|nr:beta-lactamase family protein [Actinomycetes bacterium]
MPWRFTPLTVALALALLAGACSSESSDSSSTSLADELVAPGTACDETAAVGEEGETVAEIVESVASEAGLSSVLYQVTRGDELIAADAVGESQAGVDADQSMRFRTGNVAFAWMGTLLLLFDEHGDASLDDPVSEWLPDLDVPNADEVTLKMLAQSTSGYPDYVPDAAFNDDFYADPFRQWKPSELLDVAFAQEPFYEPGTAWNYAHTNYVILGAALAEIGGKPLDELLTEMVTQPMGLDATAAALTPALPVPALHTYSSERSVWEETTFWNPSWQTAPGSVFSTDICDLAASAVAVGTGTLLSDEAYASMVAPDTVELGAAPDTCPEGACRQNTESVFYGLGVISISDWIVQTPLFGGMGAVHAYLPEADLAVAIVTVAGQASEVDENYAMGIWKSIAEELTPEHVPPG